MKMALVLAAFWLGVKACAAGTISGVVRAKPKLQEAANPSGGSYSSRKFKFVELVNYNDLHDFVVYIEGPVAGGKPPTQPRKIVQKGAAFQPHVLPVMVGTQVEWPNEDEIFHNVFSKSDAKSFDLDLYKKGDPPKLVTFDKPGKVDVFCSIHAKMNCIVLVLQNPYFATANAQGAYVIPDVPAGRYKLTAWHERLPNQTSEIVVPEEGDVKADFTMGINNLPKY
jgi:plastocyanin